jgi:alcohol dehydrogenase, propanol-preferring
VFAFTKRGDLDGQRFTMELGATWEGDSSSAPPERVAVQLRIEPFNIMPVRIYDV